MNGNYYQTPVFLNDLQRDTYKETEYNPNISMEQSYIENILRNNIGKKVRVHASFADSNEWKDRVFVGIIEHAGRDNLVINDKENSLSIEADVSTKIDYVNEGGNNKIFYKTMSEKFQNLQEIHQQESQQNINQQNQRNYNLTKEKKNHPERMETKKYCRFCQRHTLHKETK